MCDYSLHSVASRPARVGDRLITTGFHGTLTHGFAAAGEPDLAVCLLPGTELSFEEKAHFADFWRRREARRKTAIFRRINADLPDSHHDALEFDDGRLVLLDQLDKGQHVTVLQLPASPDTGGRIVHEHRAVPVG